MKREKISRCGLRNMTNHSSRTLSMFSFLSRTTQVNEIICFLYRNIINILLENTKSNLNLKIDLHVSSISVILRDNDVIDALKDLQKHYIYYNDVLDKQHELKQSVIEHIKNNFVKLLTKDSMNISLESAPFAIESNDLYAGNFDPKATLEDYINLITKRTVNDPPPKLLLSCTLDGITVELRSEDKQQVVQVGFKKIHCLDLLGVNHAVKDVVLVKEELKAIYSSNAIQKKEKEIVSTKLDRVSNEDIKYINEVMIDIEASKINVFLTKPFVERLCKLIYIFTNLF